MTVENERFLFWAFDPMTGAQRPLAQVHSMPSVFGDWALAPDGESAALPNHDPGAPEIRIVSFEGEAKSRIVKVKSDRQLWGVRWDSDGAGWLGELRSGDTHVLAHIGDDGTISELYRSGYNTWAIPSPDGRKLAFLDYTTDRNVWIWKR